MFPKPKNPPFKNHGSKGKWSRKQILGHLIDSAINNLQRFTEIGYQPQPYVYREYHQAELVQMNDYQNMDTKELLQLWLSLNKQIARVMHNQTEERLDLKVLFTDGELSDLRFIMQDYPEHMEYHLNQIVNG
ncbi:DinB family protein [Flavobacterium sp.]|uniref:DinB family protein n=1 Tax=Flavobacterium sp. TaxID=239 RepID=UPI0039E6D16F